MDVMEAGYDCYQSGPSRHLTDISQKDSEFIFVDLLLSHNRKITLGVFYRPLNNDPKPLEDLQAVLQEFSTNELILLGDFNLPEIDWLNNKVLRQSDIYTLMMDVVQDNFLTQLINEPTTDSNILDLVLTTSPDLVDNLVVGETFQITILSLSCYLVYLTSSANHKNYFIAMVKPTGIT